MKIILATQNKGKIKELKKVFSQIGWDAVSISEVASVKEPEEKGKTFEENAINKALYYSKAISMPVLADDSGIIADVLKDRPGIYSARFSGVHGDDKANNRKLVEELRPYKGNERSGYYMCVIALVWPNGKYITAQGKCEGIIRDFEEGCNGFGYDPLFYLPEKKCTMAQLTLEEKNKISHRGKAIQNLIEKLKKYKSVHL